MNKSELAEIFVKFLKEEGYKTSFDEDGDIDFKYEGGSYCLALAPEDPIYFRLIFPNFWSIDSDDERVQVERAAMRATAEVKVAKFFSVRNNVWGTVELFCPSPEAFISVLFRSLSSIQDGVSVFRREMRSD